MSVKIRGQVVSSREAYNEHEAVQRLREKEQKLGEILKQMPKGTDKWEKQRHKLHEETKKGSK